MLRIGVKGQKSGVKTKITDSRLSTNKLSMKKVPLRTCIGCRETKPKKELIRLVRTLAGEIKLDLSSKLSGRGAYFCRKSECFEMAVKKKRIPWALKTEVNQSELEELQKIFNEVVLG